MNATNWRVPFASASFARLYSPAGHLTMPNVMPLSRYEKWNRPALNLGVGSSGG
jgi:hypothetical protein